MLSDIDKQLLELAAQAAGKPLRHNAGVRWFGNQAGWNPIEKDGDAFRLGVDLNILTDSRLRYWITQYLEQGIEKRSAFRRAIVRMAAELGLTLVKK